MFSRHFKTSIRKWTIKHASATNIWIWKMLCLSCDVWNEKQCLSFIAALELLTFFSKGNHLYCFTHYFLCFTVFFSFFPHFTIFTECLWHIAVLFHHFYVSLFSVLLLQNLVLVSVHISLFFAFQCFAHAFFVFWCFCFNIFGFGVCIVVFYILHFSILISILLCFIAFISVVFIIHCFHFNFFLWCFSIFDISSLTSVFFYIYLILFWSFQQNIINVEVKTLKYKNNKWKQWHVQNTEAKTLKHRKML